MRLFSRSVLREVAPPFLLGFAAYTFILLVRTIYFLADFFVRRSATLVEVFWLILLSIPWIIVLTLPMAFLLGVLIGVGRMASDSEIVAMRSCGIGPAAIYRPILAAAAVLSVVVFAAYNFLLPWANETLSRSLARVAATSVVNVVQPRTFREVRPGLTFFFDRAAPDGALQGVFLKFGEGEEPENQIIVARFGALHLEGDRLWLDLTSSTLHGYDKEDPSRYRTNFNQTQRILIAGEIGNPEADTSYEKPARSQSIRELLQTARKAEKKSTETFREAWVEIHKKIAIPLACIVFAILGIPLAERARRGGRGSGFAVSLGILVIYYVLLSSGETWAEEGTLSPGLAMWIPNLTLAALGLVAFWRRDRERARWRWPGRRGARERPPAALRLRPRFGSWLRFPALLDRYVLGRFLSMLGLVTASILLLAIIVDYADHVDKIARNQPPRYVVLGYYRYFLISIGVQVAPFAVLIATMVSLGLLSKNNEDTAFKASGISLPRLASGILVVTFLGAGFLFTLGEYVLPFAEQRQARFRNIIYGRAPDAGLSSPEERNWHYGSDGRIWYREESDPAGGKLNAPMVFEFNQDFELVRRMGAKEAHWSGDAWMFRQGWERSFGGPSETSYRTFLEERVAGDPPTSFAQEHRTPEQMRFRELERFARRLKAGGYPTAPLETALQSKLAGPMLLPVMAFLAVPFAFRVGKRGALAGIGVGLCLGMALQIATAFFSKLGGVGVLSPLLAAWSPNILSATGAFYGILRLKT
jgi:LPS export ABC transporter permease LptF/LPS export ABC transporter permease LptG